MTEETNWKDRKDGLKSLQRNGVKWHIDEHKKRWVVWRCTKVAGVYFSLSAAKEAAERGIVASVKCGDKEKQK